MRIGTAFYSDLMVGYINKAQSQLGDLSDQISSGKRVRKPSDDPVALQAIASAHNELSADQTRESLVSSGLSLLSAADSAMGEMTTALDQAAQDALGAVSTGSTDISRAAAASDIRSVAQEMIGLANSQVGSRYIFGGYQDQAPPVTGDPSSAVYAGDSNAISVPIGAGRTCPTSVSGQVLFNFADSAGNTPVANVGNVFQVLTQLADQLESGDTQGATTTIGQLDQLRDHILTLHGGVGSNMQRLNAQQTLLQDADARYNQTLTDQESVDLATAVTQYKTLETNYQAMIAIVGNVASLPTLFDRIR